MSAALLLAVAGPVSGDVDARQAIETVKQIVNQPATPIRRNPGTAVVVYRPGWFHPGAIKPDFLNVDVRQTRQLPYARHEYVTSDVCPDVMYRGPDLEFNPMTKYFYTDRLVPKKRLTEEEMLEINRLYRIIARSERPPAAVATAGASSAPTTLVASASVALLLVAAALWLYRRHTARA